MASTETTIDTATANAALWLAIFFIVVFVSGPPPAAAAESDEERSALSALLSSESDSGFAKATGPRAFEFPQDHGPHPDYRNEWWYVTGNLDDERGRRFGFELTIFRFALTPELHEAHSNWRTNQIYVAHFAVTDADDRRFYVAERYSRGALGLAGAQAQPFKVWIDDWSIAELASGAAAPGVREQWRLRASDEDFSIDLTLVAEKPPVLNGNGGLSQKSAEPGNASYYYSMTRWLSEGTVRIGDEEFTVTGLSWLDREWSSSALAADQQGWDWFALQLSDGSDLMFYNLRKTDGSRDRHSAGTWIAADGGAERIDWQDVELTVTGEWLSSDGARYPSGWQIRLTDYGLTLQVTPVIDDQELFTIVRYWEGAVDVVGDRNGVPVSGRGYVELTGYAD